MCCENRNEDVSTFCLMLYGATSYCPNTDVRNLHVNLYADYWPIRAKLWKTTELIFS